MQHLALIVFLCIVSLIWLRSTVPYSERTEIELRLLMAWGRLMIAILTSIKDRLER